MTKMWTVKGKTVTNEWTEEFFSLCSHIQANKLARLLNEMEDEIEFFAEYSLKEFDKTDWDVI